MTDSYQSWIERMAAGRDSKPLSNGEVVNAPAGEPFGVIQFCKTERAKYNAEVGKKGGDYIFHFYPRTGLAEFEDRLGDAFLEVFKFSERLEADYSIELVSWAVRARGFATNPMSDELALRIFDVLDSKLE